MNRRRFLRDSVLTGATLATVNWRPAGAAPATRSFTLTPGAARAQLVPEEYGATDVWAYNGVVPGPEFRVRQGERVRIRVRNGLGDPTTVHWHGLRLANEMDGVPWLTQSPIEPNDEFIYEFDAVDAGTFWYHPHFKSAEQIGRGLYGALVVEETEPLYVDQDLTLLLDDWRLARTAQIVEDFGNRHDSSHGGRIGNTVTVNGRFQPDIPVAAGERLRLRLVNAANARILQLAMPSHAIQIIAIDGQPVTPHTPANDRIILGPAMRVDILVDMTGKPDQRYALTDDYYSDQPREIAAFAYTAKPAREQVLDSAPALPSNPIAEPDLRRAIRHHVAFEGGAMGTMAGAMMDGKWQDIREMVHAGVFWSINGVATTGHLLEPMLSFSRGESVVLTLENQTTWPHPIHLHGHSFRVIARNGQPTPHREWQDTILIDPGDTAQIAFVADNPGDWMFHCHILEHQASGMMGVIRVA